MKRFRFPCVLALSACLTLFLFTPQGNAARSDFSLVSLSGSEDLHHGDQVTFEVSTTATDHPYVNVRCYQGSAFVYDGWEGFYAAAWSDQTFTLSGPYWTVGGAECHARLVMFKSSGRERDLASLDFIVLS